MGKCVGLEDMVGSDHSFRRANAIPNVSLLRPCTRPGCTPVHTEQRKTQQALRLRYDRTTTSVLDLYCAQLQQEEQPNTASILASLATLKAWFKDFELWFNTIKSAKVPSVPVNSSTKLALFIAGASQTWQSPDDVKEPQWELIQAFLTQGPTQIKERLGLEFSSTRGKWPGQKKQLDQTIEICKHIAAK
jgi:hypothetical protein